MEPYDEDLAEGQEGKNAAAWNIAGAVVGALLAALTIFGVVASQSAANAPQEYSDVISYNS